MDHKSFYVGGHKLLAFLSWEGLLGLLCLRSPSLVRAALSPLPPHFLEEKLQGKGARARNGAQHPAPSTVWAQQVWGHPESLPLQFQP